MILIKIIRLITAKIIFKIEFDYKHIKFCLAKKTSVCVCVLVVVVVIMAEKQNKQT